MLLLGQCWVELAVLVEWAAVLDHLKKEGGCCGTVGGCFGSLVSSWSIGSFRHGWW